MDALKAISTLRTPMLCVIIAVAINCLQSCSVPSPAKREVMASLEKHKAFVKKVYDIHASSKSNEEYWDRIDREQIAQEYERLASETRHVKEANAGRLTLEEEEEIDKECEEVDKLYLLLSGNGVKFLKQPPTY